MPQEKAHKQGTSSLPVFKDDSYGMQSRFLLGRADFTLYSHIWQLPSSLVRPDPQLQLHTGHSQLQGLRPNDTMLPIKWTRVPFRTQLGANSTVTLLS